MIFYQELPNGAWFCCRDCQRIHSALQKLLVSGEEKLPESLISVINKKHNNEDLECGAQLDIKWRILNGKMASEDEAALLLSKAVAIFHVSVCWLSFFEMLLYFFSIILIMLDAIPSKSSFPSPLNVLLSNVKLLFHYLI